MSDLNESDHDLDDTDSSDSRSDVDGMLSPQIEPLVEDDDDDDDMEEGQDSDEEDTFRRNTRNQLLSDKLMGGRGHGGRVFCNAVGRQPNNIETRQFAFETAQPWQLGRSLEHEGDDRNRSMGEKVKIIHTFVHLFVVPFDS